MAENGILDYQGMNQAIYRGATSNIVVDTQSMSIEIGAGNTSHTSNLHFECNHDANVASIKLNSNVVTEFSRSKKLIKYPRVAMTGQTTSNYTVTGSSWYGSGANYEPWKAFDNEGNHSTGQLAWYSFDYSAPEAYSGTDNTFNPNHGGTTTPDLFTGAVQGEWLKIQLPHKVALDHYIMYGPNQETEFPQDWTMYGSVDGTNWDRVDSRVSQVFGAGTGASGTATGKKKEYQLDTQTDEYLYFAFVFTKASPNRTTYVGVGEIELYGTPEYDPEAYGTDVTLKSLANVPNTDWLEVYYDAKNYTNGLVQDETTNNRDAAMNATFDNGEIKAFSFSGAYTSNVTTSDHGLGTGDVTYTMSYWFKRTAVAGSYDYIVMLGDGGVTRSSILMWINNNQLVLDHWSAALRVSDPIKLNKWYHVAAGHRGGDTPSLENDFIYINGKRVTPGITQTPGSFTLAGSKLTLGSEHNGTTEFLNGKIANFRLFNRALTSDEVWQLYAYQKEYFGHGDLSMTLKAGRLYVNGDIHANGGRVWPIPNAVFQRLTPSTTSSSAYYSNNIGTQYVTFDTIYLNDDSRTIQFSPSSTNITLSRTGVYEIITQSALALQNASTATHAGIDIHILSGGATRNSQYGYATFPTMGYGAIYNISKTHKITVTSAPAIVRYRIQPRANNSGYLKETAYGPNNVLHSIDIKYLG